MLENKLSPDQVSKLVTSLKSCIGIMDSVLKDLGESISSGDTLGDFFASLDVSGCQLMGATDVKPASLLFFGKNGEVVFSINKSDIVSKTKFKNAIWSQYDKYPVLPSGNRLYNKFLNDLIESANKDSL